MLYFYLVYGHYGISLLASAFSYPVTPKITLKDKLYMLESHWLDCRIHQLGHEYWVDPAGWMSGSLWHLAFCESETKLL